MKLVLPATAVVAAVFCASAVAAQSTKSKSPPQRASRGAKAPAKAPAKPTLLAFTTAPEGNQARYRVREQLAGVDLPNDAVGVSNDVTGTLLVGSDGRIVRDSSKFVVNVAGLKSDRDRRDGYVRRRTLVTDSFPTVTLVPTELRGLPATLPASGSQTFDMIGDLTVRGVTHPTTWKVTASFADGAVSGTAATAFTFADFSIAQPKVPVVLSVADTIKLEYDFKLVRR